jgi:lysozyme
VILGIDVSHYQGDVDWTEVKQAGIVFAFAKATEGSVILDTHFDANYAGMKSAQILRGTYHFFRPSVDAQAQAAVFLRRVPQLADGDLSPALDVEVSDGMTPQAITIGIKVWLETVKAKLGRVPIIYTGASSWNVEVNSTAFGNYPLWISHYTSNPAPNMPTGFASYVFWQHSDSGVIPGVTGHVDLDRFNGSLDDLNKLAGG